MNHQKVGRKFGRVKGQREAMFSTLLGSLIMHEKITTTEAKAKEAKTLIDRIVNKAKKSTKSNDLKVSVIRDLSRKLPKEAVKKLTGEFVKKFDDRNSGYTRVIKLSPRKSDSAKVAVIEFV
ncbi:50S ribosomal protein L17 [Patescibacteria group bacterium]